MVFRFGSGKKEEKPASTPNAISPDASLPAKGAPDEPERTYTDADFVTAAKTNSIKPGQMQRVQAGKRSIVLANIEGNYYAFAEHCPHQGWPLWSGDLRGENVRCFLHRWSFNVRTGETVAPENMPVHLPTYPVHIEGDTLKVPKLPPLPKKK